MVTELLAGPEPLALTPREAAHLIRVSKAEIYRLIASERVPVVMVGRRKRVLRAELERALHEGRLSTAERSER